MPAEIGLWRVDDKAVRVPASMLPLESRLEELIEEDPGFLGEPLLMVGRQVATAFGKLIDLLGVDAEGTLHVLELKRDRTPREVVAQALDYGSWVKGLGHDEVLDLYALHHPNGVPFEEAFSTRFGVSPPEQLNSEHRLTIIAADVDAATSRIIGYLADHEVPINVLFFRYFTDDGRSYLAHTWLINEAATARQTGRSGGGGREPWNGQDWYVSFGEESGIRDWDDARTYGFVSAGGGRWFSKTLRALPIGGRVFACIPGTGYVGVGTVSGEAMPHDNAVLDVGGKPTPMVDLPLKARYRHTNDAEDNDEYVVPVSWSTTVPREEAVWEKGMFANQNSACRLRNRFTLEELAKQFDLAE